MAQATSIVDELQKAILQAERRGITRYRIAKLSGLSQGMLSRFMGGESVPHLDSAEKIALALGKRLILADS